MLNRLMKSSFLLILLFFTLGMKPAVPEEGMYPLSEIKKIDLAEAGFKIGVDEIYNPEGVSLVDALVKVGGCTGSFVSAEGLIITNHHCAFRAVSAASTTEQNYLKDGFLAENKEDEIPAKGYVCRITESYEDVSEIILDAVKDIDDPLERSKIIEKKIEELEDEATDKENSIEAAVSEMFTGKTYILFKYKKFDDVRMVYIPPRSIGEFGGETDNWVWPRHTGDFSFLRVYVSPDGNPAEYSEDNVPYQPKKYLKVNPQGVKEEDFVFILGYPGRTYRNQTAGYLKRQEDIQLPYISELYGWMIDQIEEIAGDDPALQLKYSSTIKGLANTMKNYRGKLKGLRKIDLVNKKIAEEKEIAEFIKSKSELSEKYSSLLADINAVQDEIYSQSHASLWFSRFRRLSPVYALSRFIIKNAEQKELPDDERESAYRDKNFARTVARLEFYFKNFHPELEFRLWNRMLNCAGKFEGNSSIETVKKNYTNMDSDQKEEFLRNNIAEFKIYENEFFDELLDKSVEDLEEIENPLFQLIRNLNTENEKLNDAAEENSGKLSKLMPGYIDVKRAWNNTSFIPDANGTLRLTYGRIRGYSPSDAVRYSPISSLSGIIEKNILANPEYAVPDKLKTLYNSKDFGNYYNKELGSVPVGILYNTDTTGGNSGSPILNAYGELIGVNFDRAFEATINDFAWNESYSRSIGVDIRYVLWVMQKFSGAENIFKEMEIKL